jgi:hypothetical protein
VVLFFGGCVVVGAVSMAFIDESTPFWVILLLQGIRASGVSGLISPLTSWSMEDLPGKIMTDGSSFNTAARQAIASMGTALMVLLITLGLQLLGSASLGFHLAFGLSGVFAVLMYLIVLTRVR